MIERMKKALFWVALLCMIVSLVPSQAFAAAHPKPPVTKRQFTIGGRDVEIEIPGDSAEHNGSLPRIQSIPDIRKIVKAERPSALSLTLKPDEKWACATVFDGKYAYIGLNMGEKYDYSDGYARIVKVDVKAMKEVASIELTKGFQTRVHALAIQGHYLIHGSYTNPAIYTVIDTRTMKEVGEPLVGEVLPDWRPNDKMTRPMIDFDGYIYLGCDTQPGKVVKLHLDKDGVLTRAGGLLLDSGENSVFSLTEDGRYLYAGLETSPAKVVKIDPRTMTKVAIVTLAADEINAYSLAYGDGHIYAGCYAEPYISDSVIPVKVVKINNKTMTRVGAFTGDAGDIGTRTALFAEGHLYVGTWTGPGRILKIDPRTMTKESTLVLTSTLDVVTKLETQVNFTSCFVRDGDDILSGCDMSPAHFVRILDVIGKDKKGR
jgi:hypothetical protein